MLISPRHFIDRLRHPRSRADELASLRARFAAQPNRRQATTEQRCLATELRQLRCQLHDALQRVRSCGHCAKGHPLPAGRWNGGHCCSGKTLDLFTPDEVGALKLSGTAASTLCPPQSDHAGCSFRGPSGCSLEPADRPNICVRYICGELRQELRGGPEHQQIASLSKALAETFQRFVASRQAAELLRVMESDGDQ